MDGNMASQQSGTSASGPFGIFSSVFMGLLLQKYTPTPKTTIRNKYDYIIAGGGSAGSVMASRLSEMPCVNVLVLEAGPPPPVLTEVPALSRAFVGGEIDWNYLTAPQKYCCDALNNNQVQWPSGKTIGGSSVINAMLYVRGNRKNYDDWAAMGATGWSYKDVLPYFRRMEENREPDFTSSMYHGTNGPITAERPKYNTIYKQGLREAAIELGYPIIDSNGEQQFGFFDYTATVRDARRCSAAKAYLVPADRRPNLDIVLNALVRKVLIENGRAVGVEVEHNGVIRNVTATREVIVSSGAVRSAQLLLLSGIGPRQHLKKMNIPVVADLPVGLNFQDHEGVVAVFTATRRITPFLLKAISPINLFNYMASGSGPLVSSEAINFVAFLTNTRNGSRDTVPDHELFLLEGVPIVAKTQMNMKKEYYESYLRPTDTRTTLWCVSQITNPKSRGSITLRTTNPNDEPIIDPNFYEVEQDLIDVVEGLKRCYEIFGSNAMKKLKARPLREPFPGCEQFKDDLDKFLTCYARAFVMTLSHPAGTATMGDPRDPNTVVDPQLRVKGIKGLRVVDASVMPLVPSGNTNVPTMMVAEKASDMIKATISCR